MLESLCDCPPRSFTINNIFAAPETPGLYLIWDGRVLVYVGQTTRQGIRSRLFQHWNGSHNEYLALCIRSRRRHIRFCWIALADAAAILHRERELVKRYHPEANKYLKARGEP